MGEIVSKQFGCAQAKRRNAESDCGPSATHQSLNLITAVRRRRGDGIMFA
jgi:hypothetical protein